MAVPYCVAPVIERTMYRVTCLLQEVGLSSC
jgi:hypothetical protein